jgi:hypothetical protein
MSSNQSNALEVPADYDGGQGFLIAINNLHVRTVSFLKALIDKAKLI